MQDNIVLLGSTGSIGTQTLDIARDLGLNILALCAKSNIDLLEKQAREFRPEYVSIVDQDLYLDLKYRLKDMNIRVLTGQDSLTQLASLDKAQMVINAIVGLAGLRPTLSALESGKVLGLANKESLVVAGELLTQKIKFKDQLLPIDSEHSAIFQCLRNNKKNQVDKILLTASGGPFFKKTREELSCVTVEEALNHPNWSMGKKISIDSATLMNKGLELIEASVLFDIDPKDIKIIIHRESIVHSMVQYIDTSVIAQLSVPDMRLPIQYAICFPERVFSNLNKLDLTKIKNLSFDEPDFETFGCLKLAIEAANKSNIYPCVLNAANEEAVNLFLNKKIKFLDIESLIKKALENQEQIKNLKLKDIFDIDTKVRNFIKETVR
ncbi:MAG: 1-deoxy-D-xylulose-5-phosphate reductoisomerase [Oscillospiraceae bacterium]|nr:1-deoxy-D-xylulose-5-phosphate reductoisomerase [Oscillospiraceae bacterium]